MKKFVCPECSSVFESEGTKKVWDDPVYGSCWKYIAVSPCCNAESGEYSKPKMQKNQASTAVPACGGHCHSCEYKN